MAHENRSELENGRAYSRDWINGQIATGRRFIPNVPVITHQGDKRLFYDDLVKDRTVIVQFMSVAHHAKYPVTRNLIQLQRLLRGRLGRDIFLYSVTVDPQNDTPVELSRFAKRHAAGPGWLFVTGEENAVAALKNAFFVHGPGQSHHSLGHGNGQAADAPDCSMGLMRYGNDRTGLWGSVPAKTDPSMIVERLSWIQPGRRAPSSRPVLKRRGPMPTA